MTAGFKALVAGALTLATGLLGGWDLALQGLVAFIVADYLAALLLAVKTGRFSSSIGVRGFVKKLALLVGVAVAHGLDVYLFAQLGHGPWARTLAAWVFMLNEAASAIANLSAIGVRLPTVVTEALQAEIQRKRGGTP